MKYILDAGNRYLTPRLLQKYT